MAAMEEAVPNEPVGDPQKADRRMRATAVLDAEAADTHQRTSAAPCSGSELHFLRSWLVSPSSLDGRARLGIGISDHESEEKGERGKKSQRRSGVIVRVREDVTSRSTRHRLQVRPWYLPHDTEARE